MPLRARKSSTGIGRRCTGGQGAVERGQVIALQVWDIHDGLPHRRHQQQLRRPLRHHRIEDGNRIERRQDHVPPAQIDQGQCVEPQASDVEHRKCRHSDVGRTQSERRGDSDRVRAEVLVRDHGALRATGGSGRVHDHRHVVTFRHRRHRLRIGSGQKVIVLVAECDHLAHPHARLIHRSPGLSEGIVHEKHFRTEISQQVADFGRREANIDRREDRAELRGGEQDLETFHRRGYHRGDPVSSPDTEPIPELVRQPVRAVLEFAVGP